jgi:hypothetical protein
MNKLMILLMFISCNTNQVERPKTDEISQETKTELKKENMPNENHKLQMIDSILFDSESLGKVGKIEKAREKVNSAIKLSNELGLNEGIANSLFHLSKLEYKYGVKEIAELSFDKSYDMYKVIGDTNKLDEIKEFGVELFKYLGKEDKLVQLKNEPK